MEDGVKTKIIKPLLPQCREGENDLNPTELMTESHDGRDRSSRRLDSLRRNLIKGTTGSGMKVENYVVEKKNPTCLNGVL